ncbi:MAG: hypothetical protein NTZ46_04250 [Verrucomicrobia bacterium]|nr:hypothetical protein [Verrucomicrobiota bacterium]
MSDENPMAEYRGLLTKMEQESQADFDKTVLTLSGGALGLSFAFTKDVVGTENVIHTGFLLSAWIGWGLSSTVVLLSFFTSQLALRKAIRQLDDGKLEQTDKERMERPGGWYDWLTARLNLAGLCLFLFGLAMMLVFLCFNVKDHMKEKSNTHAENAGLLVPPPSPAVKQKVASAKDSASNLQQPPTSATTKISPANTSNQVAP